MPRPPPITITCLPSQQQIQTENGANVFHALRNSGVPVAFSCSGEGICAQCVLHITPNKNVTPESKQEQRRKQANRIDPELRISCLCKAKGDITVQASYW